MSSAPLENYGVVGDLHTVALVGMDGSIDFMCFPAFDSPTVFAALLDTENGGRFRLAPVLGSVRHKQLYLPDTNILLTRFLADEGVAEVSDFMAIQEMGHAHDLVRRAKAVRGDLRFRMECAPAFDYARAGHSVEQRKGEVIFTSRGDDRTVLRLRAEVPLKIVDGTAVAEFELKAGESAAFVLEDASQEGPSPSEAASYVSEAFKETMNFWRGWLGRCNYHGRWREIVHRSALTLKLLTYAPSGALVAAPTFGLPEEFGGTRNWDYRYTWIRDASFTLFALMRLGYEDEATAFMSWIADRCRELKPDGALQVMYGIRGEQDLGEQVLSHLAGYRGSRPVRIGNGAHQHLQLDIYGELLDSVYIYDKHFAPIGYDLWQNLVRLIEWVCKHWNQPDQGIWEVRGGAQPFLYSRLMCWVAIDRGIRVAQRRSFPAPLAAWTEVRDRIYEEIYNRFWDPECKAFVQYQGAKSLDASALLMPVVNFISPRDPRWISTLQAIERSLVRDSLVQRYDVARAAADGLPGNEGTFTMCSFWFVECQTLAGDLEKARFIFEKILGYANHLGLYAEELGPTGEHRGNFPQAFTHLGLIKAAFHLDAKLEAKGASNRAHA